MFSHTLGHLCRALEARMRFYPRVKFYVRVKHAPTELHERWTAPENAKLRERCWCESNDFRHLDGVQQFLGHGLFGSLRKACTNFQPLLASYGYFGQRACGLPPEGEGRVTTWSDRMATKRRPASPFGPRVTNARPARGGNDALLGSVYAEELTKRVRAAKERRGWTWKQFAERIGMSENALQEKKRERNPTPFTAEEIARMCVELRIRPEYLLIGAEPMFDERSVRSDEVSPLKPLTAAIYEHLVDALRARVGTEREGVTTYLPEPSELLVAIELGVGDAWKDNFDRQIDDRLLVSKSVRAAIGDQVRSSWEPVDASPETIKRLTADLMAGPPRLSNSVAAAAAIAIREDEDSEIRQAGVQASACGPTTTPARPHEVKDDEPAVQRKV